MGQMKLGECTAHTKRSKADEFKEKYRGKRDNLDEVRHIEGFPVGEDEDIHKLSDPPYYTAYPNPHIKEFTEKFGKPYDEKKDTYHRDPFVGDVREGKNDSIYNVCSYHTKVPHKAIMRFIEHYTEPGDIVFDGFCGTGMTGVAAHLLKRKAILVELCPIATFMAYCMNQTVDLQLFVDTASRIIEDVEEECGWLYETVHKDSRKGQIRYAVWSDHFLCPYCNAEFVYWDLAVDEQEGRVSEQFRCGVCDAKLKRRGLQRSLDERGKKKTTQVMINYQLDKCKFEKRPSENDLQLCTNLSKLEIPFWHPNNRMPEGDEARRNDAAGITHVSDFYTRRNLWVLASLFDKIRSIPDTRVRNQLIFLFTSQLLNISKLNRFRRVTFPYNPLSGTLYIASNVNEANVLVAYKNKLRRMASALSSLSRLEGRSIISTQSATDLRNVPASSVDYIFTDPPFGSNLWYSELNFLYEVWLKVLTNPHHEAVINKTQGKRLDDYRGLMLRSFKEMYRILKPNRWITVEFHNSKASVWNAIQESLAKAGFIIAQVAILDKKQGTFKQVTAAGAVRNDLIINGYKPKESFAKAFLEKAGYGLEKDFVEQHLEKLPVDQNIERTEQMLYSKMLAYYIQHGYEINMNAKQFYSMLQESFEERDGYWFLYSQVDVYEEKKRRQDLKSVQATLFISDERSAIQWLNWFISEPKGYDEIYPEFVQVLTTTPDKVPELGELLGENFVSVDDKYRRPRALEKEEIEERRNKRLLREFEGYLEEAMSGSKLDSVRKEAVVSGFILCYQEKRFEDILTIARRIPRQIIESSTEIYDLIDVAETKVGA